MASMPVVRWSSSMIQTKNPLSDPFLRVPCVSISPSSNFHLIPSFSSGVLLSPSGSRRFFSLKCKSNKPNVSNSTKPEAYSDSKSVPPTNKVEEEEEEEYEEVSWITDKVESAKEFTSSVIQRTPGPRVGSSSVPWLIALPSLYFSITFAIAIFRTVNRWRAPKAKRRRLIGKNAVLVESLDEIFSSGRENLTKGELSKLQSKCGFSAGEVFRKYVRYALNEKPFDPPLVGDLLHLRRACALPDPEVVDVVNDIAKRTVKAKGAVMMDTRGLTEKGILRKAAVQSIFTKLLYLTELDEFCSPESKTNLEIKAIFGVTDEDAEAIRMQTLSQASDFDSMEGMLSSEGEDEKEKDL